MASKLFITFLVGWIFIISATGYSQSSYNKTDGQGLKQGKWIKMWNNGMVKYKGQFQDNRPYGEFRYFYPSGKLKAVMTFSENGKKAHNISYHENGKKLAEGEYANRKKEGVWRYYSDQDGKLVSEERYENGKLNGKVITYYPETGKPFEIVEYKIGVKEGAWI